MAEQRLARLDPRLRSLADRAAATRLRVTISSAQDNNARAIELSLDFLRLIGVHWSAHPTREEAVREYEQIWQRLGGRPIETLIDLPLVMDPDRQAILDALAPALPPAVFTDLNLSCLLTCWMVNQTLQYGNCDASCFAYVMLAKAMGPYFGTPPLDLPLANSRSTSSNAPDWVAIERGSWPPSPSRSTPGTDTSVRAWPSVERRFR